MDIQDRIQGGLDVVRREAKGARGKRRSWKTHAELLRMAAHILQPIAASSTIHPPSVSRELAELMRL